MAYSTNIYDLYKKVEENHHNITEAMKMKFAVVNNNGEVIGFTSDAKEAMFMAKNNLRKEKGTVVQLSKPMPQKQADMKIGRKLFAQNTREYLETAKVVEESELDERVTSTAFRKKTARVNPMTQKDIERMIKDRKYKGNTSALMKAVKKRFPDEYESDIVQDMMKKHAETNEQIKEKLDDDDEDTVKDVIKGLKKAVKTHQGQVSTLTKDIKDGFASDAQRRAAFAQGYKAKGKKGKKEEVKEKLMNAYRQQWKELGEKRDPADIDMKATSKDQEMADQNVVMQLRKAGNLGGTKEVKFGDGKKVKVKPQIAQRVMSKMMTLRTTQEKEKFQQQIGKSYKDLLNALK